MKYSTFRIIRLTFIISLVIASFVVIMNVLPDKKEVTNEQSIDIPRNTIRKETENTLTAIDKQILDLQKNPIEKNIDKTGKNYKKYKKYADFIVDIRCDFSKGFSYWNRIKVDFDKDKNYDEKWTFGEKGNIRKSVSTYDDGNYDVEYELVNSTWIRR